MANSIDEIVAGYFKYLETKEDGYFWAWLAVDDACHSLSEGVQITLRLIELAPTKWIRDCVAAHALEDLVIRHGVMAVREIDQLARCSKTLRQALPVINLDEDNEVFEQWEKLLARHEEYGDSNAL